MVIYDVERHVIPEKDQTHQTHVREPKPSEINNFGSPRSRPSETQKEKSLETSRITVGNTRKTKQNPMEMVNALRFLRYPGRNVIVINSGVVFVFDGNVGCMIS